MATRKLGVLLRQLVGNGNNPPRRAAVGLLQIRTLNSSPIPNTTPPSSPYPPFDPKIFQKTCLPFSRLSLETSSVFSYISNGHLLVSCQHNCLTRQSTPYICNDFPLVSCKHDCGSVIKNIVSVLSNGFLVVSCKEYCETLKKVQDEHISAVFFFTSPYCKPPLSYEDVLNPIFYDICQLFPHVAIFLVYTESNGGGIKLRNLGVYDRPVLHIYLKGEKLGELDGASEEGLINNLENIYNVNESNDGASVEGLKEYLEIVYYNHARNDEGFDSSQLIEIPPAKFSASSLPKLTEAVESLPDVEPGDDLWWFAQGLFLSEKKRSEFFSIQDLDLKLQWLQSQMAEE